MTVILIDVAIVAVLLTADLLSKHFVESFLLSRGGVYEVIEGVLTFNYSKNTGAAFGIFSNSRLFLSIFVGVVILGLIGFLVYHIVKKKYREKGGIFLHVALSFIIAGGIGNLVDRIAFGYVRDFIEYSFIYTLFKKNFAVCNLADVFLAIGVILVVVYLIILMVDESKKQKSASAEQSAKGGAPEEALPPESEEVVEGETDTTEPTGSDEESDHDE